MIKDLHQKTANLKLDSLTQSQLLIWTGQQLNPDMPLYNQVFAFSIEGKLDPLLFRKAFQWLVQSSDAMRTVFPVVDGIPSQKVLDQMDPKLELLDWSEAEVSEHSLEDWLTRCSQTIFDLTNRCFDSTLIKLSDDEFIWYLNQHHIITDAWGVSTQFNALAEVYKSLELGENPVNELPGYYQYRIHEQDSLESPQFHQSKSFWDQKIEDSPPAPRLYGYRHQVLGTQSQRISVSLGPERTSALRKLCQEPDIRTWTEHLSLFSIFTTILFSYVYRVSGQDRISLGTPTHHRSERIFKEIPGLFIEVYPLMVAINPDDSFQDILKHVQKEINLSIRHSIPGVVSPELNHTFHGVLNYIHATFSDFNGRKVNTRWIHSGHSDPRHQIRLQIHDFDQSDDITLQFDLNLQVFNQTRRDRVGGHFLKLVDAFIENRNQQIGKPAMVGDSELRSIFEDLNPASETGVTPQDVIKQFHDQVTKHPESTVLYVGNQSISYKNLDNHSNKLANLLISKGVGTGQKVVLHLDRSIELITSILGVLKTGAAYVPIDTNYPQERISFILEDLEPSLVISKSKLGGRYGNTPVFEWDSQGEELDAMPDEAPAKPLRPQSLAYIMYTSGTTGKPKGVMISHQALSNYISWGKKAYLEGERLTFPLFTTPAFDLTVTSIFLPLVSGGEIVIYPEPENGPDLSILEVMDGNQVDIVKLTPSHLGLLNKSAVKKSCVKKLIVGGENFSAAQAEEVKELFLSDVQIFNEYGPTEATVGCIVHRVETGDLKANSVPIGKPITNTGVFLLDAQLNPVPQGVTGELYLSGQGLADGYWNQPSLTDETFVACPFKPGSKMYRTGDLARLNQQHDLEYLGRSDRQVKVAGIRMELGEIESVLSKHPAIDQAVVALKYRTPTSTKAVVNCNRCGLPSNYPSLQLDEEGICNICRSFEGYKPQTANYFGSEEKLAKILDQYTVKKTGPYDCMVLLSGGKDSTYALASVVNMGYKVLAFTLDNGYISEQAKANIKRVVNTLEVDHVFGKTDAMNAIFVDSLNRHANVCNGCFKTIYTLSTTMAMEKGIPVIVTGLSRGQLFETRLTEELFKSEDSSAESIDETVVELRKAYHATDDAVNRLLDVSVFEDSKVFDKVHYVDFYRYSNVKLDEMYSYLDQHLPWVRPSDTGRSTNCLINQVGIYVHRKQKGYSNYAYPYSWDVRMGHKTRDAALDEINESVDEREVKRIMEEIGYQAMAIRDETQVIAAYYVSENPVDSTELHSYLAEFLPEYMIPTHFRHLKEMPLTGNGKVDYEALPGLLMEHSDKSVTFEEPRNQIEQILVDLWKETLKIPVIGIRDNFTQLGGNSLMAIRLLSRINLAFKMDLPLNSVFQYPTIAEFGTYVERTIDRLLEQHTK